MPRPILALALAMACDTPTAGLDAGIAQAAVEQAFREQNPPGRTGLELKGHAVWLETAAFNPSCLEEKDLAFNDSPGERPAGSGPRISPTYMAQRWITASTPKGVCVYLGETPTLTVEDSSWGGDRYRVKAKFGMEKPSPWFECLDPAAKERIFEVFVDEQKQPRVEGSVDLFQGGCPKPLPGGEDRPAPTSPPRTAHKSPSKAEVKALVEEFDKALFDGDLSRARSLTACYNLVDEAPFYGNCSVGELIAVGPSLQGEPRAQDGTPWLEYSISSLDDLGAIKADGRIPGMYHVTMTHKRTGRDRSFSVQWVDDAWKLVGVVGQKAEGLTPIRYVYDLHRADRRKVFERRLAGEKLDEAGEPLEPPVEE